MTILHPRRTALLFSPVIVTAFREMGGVKREAGAATREKLNDYLLHFPLWTPQRDFIKS